MSRTQAKRRLGVLAVGAVVTLGFPMRASADSETPPDAIANSGKIDANMQLYTRNAQYLGGRDSFANPGNIFDLDSAQHEIGAVASVRAGAFQLRAKETVTRANDSARTKRQGRLIEADIDQALNDELVFTIGKRITALDVGTVFSPLGFFQVNRRTADVYDNYSDIEGVPQIGLKWVGRIFSAQAIVGKNQVSDPSIDNEVFRGSTGALKLTANLDNLSLAAVILRQSSVGTGAALIADGSVTDSTRLYATAFAQRGTARTQYAALGAGANVLAFRDRSRDGQLYTRCLIGLQSDFSRGFSILAEIYHDSSKLSRSDWNSLRGLIQQHAPVSPRALGEDWYAIPQNGALRTYGFARIGKVAGDSEYSLRYFGTPQFDNGLAILGYTARLSPHYFVDLTASKAVGGSMSEYRLFGIRTRLDYAFRIEF